MKLEETTLSFLKADCLETFGSEQGSRLYVQTQAQFDDLLANADYRNSSIIQEHLQRKLFPPMAYYLVLRKNGLDQNQAIYYVKKETHKAAELKKAEMQSLAKLPFAYNIYRMGVKKHMRKNFPAEGWETEWVRCDRREIHFNLHRCIYWDISQQCGCPELCQVYCENDDISFSGLLPRIQFRRSGTLGEGAACCDFHFIRT